MSVIVQQHGLLRTAVQVFPPIPALVGSFANNPGSIQTANATFTLPTVADGDVGLYQVTINGGPTTADPTLPSGWSVLVGPTQNAANNLRSWLIHKPSLSAAESGTTVTTTFAVGFRWNITGVVLRNADPVANTGTDWADTSDDLTLTIPAITPSADDVLLVVLSGMRYAGTSPLGVTPTGTWAELQDIATTNGTVPTIGAWAGTRNVYGSAGIAVPSEDMAFASNARGNGFVLAYSYAVPAPAGQTVTPDLASSVPSALAPSVSTTVTATPDVATSTPATFAPTITATVVASPGVATSTPGALAPAVTATVTVSPGVASSPASAYAPDIATTTPGVTVTPDAAASTAQASAPTVTTSVTASPGLASSTATALAPAVSATVTVTAGIATSAPAALAPTVTTAVTVAPGAASSAPAAYAPVINLAGGPTTVIPGVATSTPQAYAPAATTTVTVAPGVVVGSPQAFAPASATVVVAAPDAATGTAQAYAPTASVAGAVDYTPHLPVTATVEPSARPATIVGDPAATALLEDTPAAAAELHGDGNNTATLTGVLGSATLHDDGANTATLTPVAVTAELVTA